MRNVIGGVVAFLIAVLGGGLVALAAATPLAVGWDGRIVEPLVSVDQPDSVAAVLDVAYAGPASDWPIPGRTSLEAVSTTTPASDVVLLSGPTDRVDDYLSGVAYVVLYDHPDGWTATEVAGTAQPGDWGAVSWDAMAAGTNPSIVVHAPQTVLVRTADGQPGLRADLLLVWQMPNPTFMVVAAVGVGLALIAMAAFILWRVTRPRAASA